MVTTRTLCTTPRWTECLCWALLRLNVRPASRVLAQPTNINPTRASDAARSIGMSRFMRQVLFH